MAHFLKKKELSKILRHVIALGPVHTHYSVNLIHLQQTILLTVISRKISLR